MASDAVVAAGVVVAGGLILWTGWRWLDPANSRVIGAVIGAVIVVGTWSLLWDSVDLSLDADAERHQPSQTCRTKISTRSPRGPTCLSASALPP
jgi:Co/Zn/Cd efflux system component